MEEYLRLFENAIEVQSKLVGRKRALTQAKAAGLSVSASGHIVSCVGNPVIVLLRLIKSFTKDGNIAALEAVGPLIERMAVVAEEMEGVAE